VQRRPRVPARRGGGTGRALREPTSLRTRPARGRSAHHQDGGIITIPPAGPTTPRRHALRAARTACVLAALVALAGVRPARAQQWVYGSNATGIYRINTATGAGTLIYSGAPFAGSYVAGLAQRPSDGMLFFLYGSAGNDAVYRWDPATPATAPVLLGTTGAGVGYIPRLAFDLSGNLWGIDVTTTNLYPISQTTGAAGTGVALTGGPAGQTGGDIAVHPTSGLIYMLTGTGSPYTLYTVSTAGGALSTAGTVALTVGAPSGTAFNAAGTLFIESSASNNLYTAGLSGNVTAALVGNMGAALQDLASVPLAPPTVTKSFTPSTLGRTAPSVLTITLTNPAPTAQRGAGFTDTYPGNVVNTATPSGATTCTGGTVTAAAGGTSVALSGGTIPAGGSCTVTVNVTSATAGSYVNTLAASAVAAVFGGNAAAATATLTVTPLADLQVTKTDSLTSVIQGNTLTYTIIARNLGPDNANNATVSDVFPAALSSVTWTCTTTVGANCNGASGSGNINNKTVNVNSGSAVTFRATATASGAAGNIINTASASPPAGTADPPGNSTAADTTLLVVYGVSVTPDGVDTVPRLPSTATQGKYSYNYTLTNTSNYQESFDLSATAGPAGLYVTIDSITGTGVTRGALPDSARLATIGAGANAIISVWYRTAAGAATGALDTVYLRGRSLVRPATAHDSGWSYTRIVRPSLVLAKIVNPAGTVSPGTDLTYTITATNAGTDPAVGVVEVDSIAPQVRFKVGSTTSALPSGVTVTIAYSSDGGATWAYTPASAGCSAPAGYDGCVNRLRWSLQNPLSNVAPNNVASVSFIARIK